MIGVATCTQKTSSSRQAYIAFVYLHGSGCTQPRAERVRSWLYVGGGEGRQRITFRFNMPINATDRFDP